MPAVCTTEAPVNVHHPPEGECFRGVLKEQWSFLHKIAIIDVFHMSMLYPCMFQTANYSNHLKSLLHDTPTGAVHTK